MFTFVNDICQLKYSHKKNKILEPLQRIKFSLYICLITNGAHLPTD